MYGTIQTNRVVDNVHLVVTTTSQCDASQRNYLIEMDGQTQKSFNKSFGFSSNSGSTFYVYLSDHDCDAQSNIVTLQNVPSGGGSYDVGTLSITFP